LCFLAFLRWLKVWYAGPALHKKFQVFRADASKEATAENTLKSESSTGRSNLLFLWLTAVSYQAALALSKNKERREEADGWWSMHWPLNSERDVYSEPPTWMPQQIQLTFPHCCCQGLSTSTSTSISSHSPLERSHPIHFNSVRIGIWICIWVMEMRDQHEELGILRHVFAPLPWLFSALPLASFHLAKEMARDTVLLSNDSITKTPSSHNNNTAIAWPFFNKSIAHRKKSWCWLIASLFGKRFYVEFSWGSAYDKDYYYEFGIIISS